MGALFRGVLHFRLLVLGVAVGLLGLGVVSLRNAPVDVLPEFTPAVRRDPDRGARAVCRGGRAAHHGPARGRPAQRRRGRRRDPLRVAAGLSSIVMVFEPGTDIYRARQLVEERLTQAHALPNVSKPPTLLQPLSSSSRVLMIGLVLGRALRRSSSR